MGIDPAVSMAIAVQAHKGVYALLLGSGMSRAAGIPTGWEVIQALARRLAIAERADPGDDPVVWYRNRFGSDPTYSALLELVAPKPAERQSLLREFFEPTEEEREQGLKSPTTAHRAVAKLVARGFVKVICTTNFDRLMERALEDEGVSPSVVHSADQVQGMMPPQHTRCLLIKLHGDYLDTRLRNTSDELKGYEAPIETLLDRMLTEYGLIVCGWSGEWDTALTDTIQRTTTHRFSTFWMARGTLTARANELCKHRQAIRVPIEAADNAFSLLLEQVTALDEEFLADPISPRIALATVKRYLADPVSSRIRLEDLVMREARTARSKTDDKAMPLHDPVPSLEGFRQRAMKIETALCNLVPMLAAIAKWGGPELYSITNRCVAILARQAAHSGQSYNWWSSLRRYPAALPLYAVGTVAAGAENYPLLRSILVEHRITEPFSNESKQPILNHEACRALHYDGAQVFFETEKDRKRKTPASERIQAVLAAQISELFDDESELQRSFDRFEIIVALVSVALGDHPPPGCFVWRHGSGQESLSRFGKNVIDAGLEHPIFQLGVFKDVEDFKKTAQAVTSELSSLSF